MSSVRTFAHFILIFEVYIVKLGENIGFLSPPWLLLLSDVIQTAGSVAGRGRWSEGGSRIAARRSSDPQVLHGVTSADVQLSQLAAGSLLFELGNG